MNGNISVTITDRERVLFAGSVISISAKNSKGIFDILPMHANFISLMGGFLTLNLPDGKERQIPVDNGILKVRENKVQVYLGIKK